jgi:hypothetical protein
MGWLTVGIPVTARPTTGALYIRRDIVYTWKRGESAWTLVPDVPMQFVGRPPTQGLAIGGWGLWINGASEQPISKHFGRSPLSTYFEGDMSQGGKIFVLRNLSNIYFSNTVDVVQIQYYGEQIPFAIVELEEWMRDNSAYLRKQLEAGAK